MSHIKNIEIKNFKSIRHATIEDCRRVNVFIGYPNVGKSNILEALSVLQFAKQTYVIDLHHLCRHDSKSEIFFEGNIREDAIIAYNNFELVQIHYESEISGPSISTQREFNKEQKLWSHVSYPEINVLKYQFILNSSNQNVVTHKHLQSPYGENLFSVVATNLELRKFFNELLKNYGLRLIVDRIKNSLLLQKEVTEDSVFQLSYVQIADTLQRLFFYKAAILTNENSVLLFEEPEAHMYPPYISKFTGDVMYDENNNQFFITTHSPFVLNDFMEQLKPEDLAIYLVSYKNETGETIINKMSDEDMHEAAQFGYDFFLNLDNFIPKS